MKHIELSTSYNSQHNGHIYIQYCCTQNLRFYHFTWTARPPETLSWSSPVAHPPPSMENFRGLMFWSHGRSAITNIMCFERGGGGGGGGKICTAVYSNDDTRCVDRYSSAGKEGLREKPQPSTIPYHTIPRHTNKQLHTHVHISHTHTHYGHCGHKNRRLCSARAQ